MQSESPGWIYRLVVRLDDADRVFDAPPFARFKQARAQIGTAVCRHGRDGSIQQIILQRATRPLNGHGPLPSVCTLDAKHRPRWHTVAHWNGEVISRILRQNGIPGARTAPRRPELPADPPSTSAPLEDEPQVRLRPVDMEELLNRCVAADPSATTPDGVALDASATRAPASDAVTAEPAAERRHPEPVAQPAVGRCAGASEGPALGRCGRIVPPASPPNSGPAQDDGGQPACAATVGLAEPMADERPSADLASAPATTVAVCANATGVAAAIQVAVDAGTVISVAAAGSPADRVEPIAEEAEQVAPPRRGHKRSRWQLVVTIAILILAWLGFATIQSGGHPLELFRPASAGTPAAMDDLRPIPPVIGTAHSTTTGPTSSTTTRTAR